MEKYTMQTSNQKKAGIVILIWDKTNLRQGRLSGIKRSII